MAGVKLQVTRLPLAHQCCHFGLLTASEWAGIGNHTGPTPSGAGCGSQSAGVGGEGLKRRQETLCSGLIPQDDFWERRSCSQAGRVHPGVLGNQAQPGLNQEENSAAHAARNSDVPASPPLVSAQTIQITEKPDVVRCRLRVDNQGVPWGNDLAGAERQWG